MSKHNVKSNASIQEKKSNNVKKNHEDAYNNINSQKEESIMSILINLRNFKAMFAINNDRVIINNKIVFNEFNEKKTCKDKSKLRTLIIIFNITIINVISIKLKFIKLINKSKCYVHEYFKNVNALMNVNAFMNIINVNAFVNVNAFMNMF